MTSQFLNRPLRTEADVSRSHNIRILHEMAADYRHKARGAEGSENYKNAGFYRDRQHACLAALREMDPMTEGPRQALAEITSVAE